MGQNSKALRLTKLKKSNSYKTQFLSQIKKNKKNGKNNLTPQQLVRCTLGSLLQSCNVISTKSLYKFRHLENFFHVFTWDIVLKKIWGLPVKCYNL